MRINARRHLSTFRSQVRRTPFLTHLLQVVLLLRPISFRSAQKDGSPSSGSSRPGIEAIEDMARAKGTQNMMCSSGYAFV